VDSGGDKVGVPGLLGVDQRPARKFRQKVRLALAPNSFLKK
jgi:hypothetical protein